MGVSNALVLFGAGDELVSESSAVPFRAGVARNELGLSGAPVERTAAVRAIGMRVLAEALEGVLGAEGVVVGTHGSGVTCRVTDAVCGAAVLVRGGFGSRSPLRCGTEALGNSNITAAAARNTIASMTPAIAVTRYVERRLRSTAPTVNRIQRVTAIAFTRIRRVITLVATCTGPMRTRASFRRTNCSMSICAICKIRRRIGCRSRW